jgi:tetratricopeptide (TPR) repeat protein
MTGRIRGTDQLLRVSAAMIVRDEETHLDECLRSIVDEVDEIIVVDTGSTDATKDIARRYTPNVFDYPWEEDFSIARNYAIEKASGDWILYIDADERLVVSRHGSLRGCVQQQDIVALSVRFRPRVNFTPYREIRLFRRDPRIRFQGKIHETPRFNIHNVMESDKLGSSTADVDINHLGYEGDLTAKYRRNLPLLEEATKMSPERVFLWTDMAEALAGLGRAEEAKGACWRAVELAATSGQNRKQEADAVQAWRRLIALSSSSPDYALQLALRAASLYPGSHSLKLDLGNALFAVGDAESVISIVQDLVAIDAETFSNPTTAYDKRVFGEWALDLMGAAYARLGRYADAADVFERAAILAPDNLAYRTKARAFALPRAKSP